MTDLMIIEGPDVKRMTSLEISELVESRHDKVKQSIERLAARAVIELPPMGEVKNHLGQSVKVYLLDKRSSLIVVAQLSPEFTARVVDRWQELEAQVAAPAFLIPQTLPEALRLAADLAEKNGQLQHQIEADRPKTIFADAVSVSKTSILVGELSKLLKQNGVLIGPKRLFAWLREKGACSRSRKGRSTSRTDRCGSPGRPRSPARGRSISSTNSWARPNSPPEREGGTDMKVHFNNALNPKKNTVIACGVKVGSHLNTTTDGALVTCKRCQNMVGFPARKTGKRSLP